MPERVARQGIRRAFAAAGPAVCTIGVMACDEELAGRIRQLIGSEPGLTENKMFGLLAFLVGGNMAIAAAGVSALSVPGAPSRA
jgi:hypothetical protein